MSMVHALLTMLMYALSLYLIIRGLRVLPFAMLNEALGGPVEPTESELDQHQDNLLGARYVTLAYGTGGAGTWIQRLRRGTRFLLVAALFVFAVYLICATLVYNLPFVGTFRWLLAAVLVVYAGDLTAAGLQMLVEYLRGVPFLATGRRRWAMNRVLTAPKTFLTHHAELPADPKGWWYGRSWYLTFSYTLAYLLPGPAALWMALAGDDARLTAPGDWFLALGFGSLLFALLLALDGMARFSPWNGVPSTAPGYGLSVLLQDLRRPGAISL